MNILVALVLTLVTVRAGASGCGGEFRLIKRGNFGPRQAEQMPGHAVTLITRDAEVRGVVVAASLGRDGTIAVRLLDEVTHQVRDLSFRASNQPLRRVLIRDPVPEIARARACAGASAEVAFFEPNRHNALAFREWIDLNHPVALVAARDDSSDLDVLTGRLTPWTDPPETFTITTADGPRAIPHLRLIAAFGQPAGF